MIGLITGSGRGLGYEMVRLGLEKGYTMIATCHQDPIQYEAIQRLKEKYPQLLTTYHMDITDEKAVQTVARNVEEKFHHLDFIVNSAGVLFESKYTQNDAIADFNISMFRKTLEVNTVGPAIVLKYFIHLIYRSKDPCIIQVTSEAAQLPEAGYHYMAYSISKYAENMYSQMAYNFCREEKKDQHIRLYMVHPGRMDTVMGKENAQIDPAQSAEGQYELIENKKNITLSIPFINYKGEPMAKNP